MSSHISRELNLPPPGRPNFLPENREDFDLLYLSWGWREYGVSPVPVSYHDGWTYLVIVAGSPQLMLADRMVSLREGDACVLGPNCAYGLKDNERAACDVLSWIWKRAPLGIKIEPSMMVTTSLSRRGVEKLQDLHARTREEAHLSDRFSSQVLDGLHIELDGLFARSAMGRVASDGGGALRLHFALEWLHKQIGAPDPVRALCDYLQVSSSTLNRLFRAHLHSSPKEYIHQMRMEYALSLRPHYPLKEIAFILGYRHANDLSRALSRFRQSGPSQK